VADAGKSGHVRMEREAKLSGEDSRCYANVGQSSGLTQTSSGRWPWWGVWEATGTFVAGLVFDDWQD